MKDPLNKKDRSEEIREEINLVTFGNRRGEIFKGSQRKRGISQFYTTYQKINDAVNVKIKSGDFKEITVSQDHKKLQRYFQGEHTSELSVFYWMELQLIIKSIEKELDISYATHQDNLTYSHLNDELLKFQYHPFPDLGLPNYFYHLLSNGINLKLIKSKLLKVTSNLFNRNKIHVTLNSFSHAVTLNELTNNKKKIVFIPLFIFNGYGLVIKRNLINKEYDSIEDFIVSDDFEELIKNENIKFCVEKNTDLHWILYKYLKEHEININKEKLNKKIIEIESDEINSFKDNETVFLLSTNWINYNNLAEDDKYYVVKDDEFINHNNINGLIFTEQYFIENKTKIELLLKNWFSAIKIFLKDINNVPKEPTNNHLDFYCNNLEKEFKIILTKELLAKNFSLYNVFFVNLEQSKRSFDKITDATKINDYKELCQFIYQKFDENKEFNDDDLTELISRSKIIIENI